MKRYNLNLILLVLLFPMSSNILNASGKITTVKDQHASHNKPAEIPEINSFSSDREKALKDKYEKQVANLASKYNKKNITDAKLALNLCHKNKVVVPAYLTVQQIKNLGVFDIEIQDDNHWILETDTRLNMNILDITLRVIASKQKKILYTKEDEAEDVKKHLVANEWVYLIDNMKLPFLGGSVSPNMQTKKLSPIQTPLTIIAFSKLKCSAL